MRFDLLFYAGCRNLPVTDRGGSTGPPDPTVGAVAFDMVAQNLGTSPAAVGVIVIVAVAVHIRKVMGDAA